MALILIVLAFLTGSLVVEVSAQCGEVKFRGVVVTDEQWGDFVCYGSYYCNITVQEILYDPNNTLTLGKDVTICYDGPLALTVGDQVECYGYYWKACVGPMQCIGYVECKNAPYYVLRTVGYERWAILVCGSDDYWVGFQNDIEDMYLMLKNELNYDDDHIYYVAPSQWNYQGTHYYSLSKTNVSNAIQAVASRSDSDDTVFFYYTSHGWDGWLDANGDAYVDTTPPSDDISVADLDMWLDAIDPPYTLTPRKCRQMVILIQCSRSGSLLYRLSYNEAYPQWMPHLHRIIITSTDANTNSWEDMGVYGDPSWDPNRVDDDGNVANGDDDGGEFSSGFRQAFRDVDVDGYAEADEVTYPGGTFFPSGFTGGNQDGKVSVLEAFNYTDYMDCWTKRYDNPTSQAEVPGWIAVYPQIWAALYDGYSSGIDPSTTYLQEVIAPTIDADNDGLSDSREERLGTNPNDAHDPGIYCLYVNTMMTRDYFCWENIGGIDIALERLDHTKAAIVIRRGTTFNIGGPSTATMSITKSVTGLTTLTPTKTKGNWQISIGLTNTIGKYTITLTDGTWSKSMDLYVIFELPSTYGEYDTESLTEAGLKAYLYDEQSIRDDISVIWLQWVATGQDAGDWFEEGVWHSRLIAGRFRNRQYERTVFENVMTAVNGKNTQWGAALAVLIHTDQSKGFSYPDPYFDMEEWLTGNSIYGNQTSECSAFAAATTSFLRSIGIPARPVVVDYDAPRGSGVFFDHSTELWINMTNLGFQWYVMQGYSPGRGIAPRWGWYGKNRLMVTAGPNFDVTHLDKGVSGNGYIRWLTGTEVGGEFTWGYNDYEHIYNVSGTDPNGNDPGQIRKRYWVLTENSIYWGTNEPTVIGIWIVEPGDPTTRDFNLAVTSSPASLTLQQGGEGSLSISLSSTNGYWELPIFLELSGFSGCYKFEYVWQGPPTNIVRENRITPWIWGYNWQVPPTGSTNEDLRLTIKTTSSTPTGTYTLTIKGTGRDGKIRNQTATLIVTAAALKHDVAITNIKVAKTVTNDTINYVAVFVKNTGNYDETNLVVKAYYNTNLIGTKTITSLLAGNTMIVPFRWDTTTVKKGKYTISATVSTVTGETNTADNSWTNGTVCEVFLGDINADGKVDIKDITKTAMAFGSSTLPEDINHDGIVDEIDTSIVTWAKGSIPGAANWNPDADLNNDNQVSIIDVATVGNAYGNTATPRWDQDADINNDGKVDIKDITMIAMKFGYTYTFP